MRGERLSAAGAVAEEPANRRKWFAGSGWDNRGRDLILFFVVVIVAAAAISAATATAALTFKVFRTGNRRQYHNCYENYY